MMPAVDFFVTITEQGEKIFIGADDFPVELEFDDSLDPQYSRELAFVIRRS